MKKILIGLLVFILILWAVLYAMVPEKLVIGSSTSFSANREGVYRFLINDSNWKKWWPGTTVKTGNGPFIFKYKNCDFQIDKILYDAIQLNLETDRDSLACSLKLIPYSIDSIGVELSTELNSGPNPVSRVSSYFRARNIKHVLDAFAASVRNYTSNLKNIYGMSINKEKVQFQFVLSDKQSFTHYPTTEDVYAIIGRLREYIKRSAATELFSPMLNIRKVDTITYIAQAGIPVDRELPQQQNIMSKWMMKGGNILSGEVIGGPQQIDQATKQFELYIHDYQRTIIAIPFQMLITDRTKQPDSTKWITRIYYPVV